MCWQARKTPDYNRMISLAAKQALKKIVVPSVLAMIIPVIGLPRSFASRGSYFLSVSLRKR